MSRTLCMRDLKERLRTGLGENLIPINRPQCQSLFERSARDTDSADHTSSSSFEEFEEFENENPSEADTIIEGASSYGSNGGSYRGNEADQSYQSNISEAPSRDRPPGPGRGKSIPEEMQNLPPSETPSPRNRNVHKTITKDVLRKSFPKRKPMRRMRTWASRREKTSLSLRRNSRPQQDTVSFPDYPVLTRPGYRVETPETPPSVPGMSDHEMPWDPDRPIPSIEEDDRPDAAPPTGRAAKKGTTSRGTPAAGKPKAAESRGRPSQARTSTAPAPRAALRAAPKDLPSTNTFAVPTPSTVDSSDDSSSADDNDEGGDKAGGGYEARDEEHGRKGDEKDRDVDVESEEDGDEDDEDGNENREGSGDGADGSQGVPQAQEQPPSPSPQPKKAQVSPPGRRTRARTRAAVAEAKGDQATSARKTVLGKPTVAPTKGPGRKAAGQKTTTAKQPPATAKTGGPKAATTTKAAQKKTTTAKGQAVPVEEDDGGDLGPAGPKHSSRKLANTKRANTSIRPSLQQKPAKQQAKKPAPAKKGAQSKPASPAKRSADEDPQGDSPSKRRKTATKKK